MELRDTPEEAAFRAELRDWIEANLTDEIRNGRFEEAGRDWSRRLYGAGYAGLTWPKAYGGAGAPYSHQAIFLEEMARAEAPSHLGVIGLGRLGRPVATVGLAFGMDVVAWSQHLDPEDARAAGVTAVGKDELLETSDVVTIHLKLSERTTGLLGRDELARMKPTALLVNTSRGPIVDEDALVEALHVGTIGGAGLDVFEHEPAINPKLRQLENVVLLPHMGSATLEGRIDMGEKVIINIKTFADGHRPPDRVLPSML